MSEIGDSVIKGLQEAIAHAKGEDVGALVHTPKEIRARQETRDRERLEAGELDVAAIRRRLGLTQRQFAADFGFSLSSVRNWEQGVRRPNGTARVLLLVIARNPDAVRDAVQDETTQMAS